MQSSLAQLLTVLSGVKPLELSSVSLLLGAALVSSFPKNPQEIATPYFLDVLRAVASLQ